MGLLLDGPFYFLRHGESEANRAELIAGSTDTPLTPKGRLEAGRAADRLIASGIQAIYTSPLSRARDTAAIVASALEMPFSLVPGLEERDWGEMEGLPLTAITDRSITPKGGEGFQQFEDRVMGTLGRINGQTPALVVAHSGVLRVLRNRLGSGDVRGWVGNALPIHCAPPTRSDEPWTFTEVS